MFALTKIISHHKNHDHAAIFRFWGLIMFGSFSLINIIVLLNLLIAMMNHSYQLISVSSVSATNYTRSIINVFLDRDEKCEFDLGTKNEL